MLESGDASAASDLDNRISKDVLCHVRNEPSIVIEKSSLPYFGVKLSSVCLMFA